MLHDEYNRQYSLASLARSKGLDPSAKVESQTTYDLAERVEKAVGPAGIAERIRELVKIISREETALKVSEEIVLGRFGSFEEEEAAEQAVRTALAVLDEAVTVAPIQGIYDVRIRRNDDRTRHLAIYFAGPMRSAGGTEMGMTMIVGDHVRRRLNLQPFKATEGEARRFVEELRIYERAVARFQYRNSDTVLHDAMLRLPVEPNGVETDPVEVTVNRNIPRIETNRVRGGALRVINDGLLGRSQKVLRIVERLSLEGWDWLRPLKTSSAEGEEAKEFMFMEDVVGGRPIFAFPGAQGGFRVRYGRSRNTGLASVGVHPATMEILGGFLAVGVQMRTERPGKAGIVTAVDSIKPEELQYLRERISELSEPSEATIFLPNDTKIKSLLERLCLPHRVQGESVKIGEDETLVLRSMLKPEDREPVHDGSNNLERISLLAGFPVMSKAPNYVGARMGRPEKAKERVMTPKVHCLFPTGQFGGMRRDIVEASRKLAVSLDVVDRVCPSCDAWEPRVRCPTCGSLTVEHQSCPRCGLAGLDFCKKCNVETVAYKNKPVDLKQVLEAAVKRVGLAKSPEIVKGTKGLLNKTKTPEPLEKGLLRAGREVSVFKDGTIRFDATNAILTQFRPSEVGLSIEKAHLLGYEKDMEGKPLESPSQLCALEVQDLVVPETCAQYLLKASKFLDDLLSSYYGLAKFYNASKSEDLLGRLVVGLSPHTSVGVVGRIVGFTKASVCYAHPFW